MDRDTLHLYRRQVKRLHYVLRLGDIAPDSMTAGPPARTASGNVLIVHAGGRAPESVPEERGAEPAKFPAR